MLFKLSSPLWFRMSRVWNLSWIFHIKSDKKGMRREGCIAVSNGGETLLLKLASEFTPWNPFSVTVCEFTTLADLIAIERLTAGCKRRIREKEEGEMIQKQENSTITFGFSEKSVLNWLTGDSPLDDQRLTLSLSTFRPDFDENKTELVYAPTSDCLIIIWREKRKRKFSMLEFLTRRFFSLSFPPKSLSLSFPSLNSTSHHHCSAGYEKNKKKRVEARNLIFHFPFFHFTKIEGVKNIYV